MELFRYPEDIGSSTSFFRISTSQFRPNPLRRTLLSPVNGDVSQAIPFQSGFENTAAAGSTKQTLSSVLLPMPLEIADSNAVKWADSAFNILEQFGASKALEIITNASSQSNPKDFLGSIVNDLGEAGTELRKALINADVRGAALNIAVAQILKTFGSNTSASQLFTRQTGQVLNPHLELLFDGPTLRNHTFTFKMSPRSRSESLTVKRIINNFKKAMAPRTTAATQNRISGWFISSPLVFDLSFRRGIPSANGSQHPFLYSFKCCALKNISVNYNESSGENYASYYDGTPISLTMRLDFTELTPVYAEDYNERFDDDILANGVGF